MHLKFLYSVAILVLGAGIAGCGAGEGKIGGWASAGEQRVSFNSGVSWWDAGENKLMVAFMPYAPGEKERQEILKYQSLFLGMERKVPYVELNLVFKPGSAAEAATLERYYIVFGGFSEDGPLTINRQHYDWAQDGGILELSGRQGARIRGHLKRADAFRETRYEWDLPFEVEPAPPRS